MKKKKLRLISQIFFFAVVAFIALNHYLSEIGKEIPFISSASLHAICPFGGVETFIALIKFDVMVKKIHLSSIVMTSIIMILAILFGPVVCSYMCPLGSIQEWLGKLGKKIFKNKYNNIMPKKIDRVLRYMRYFVLIFTVYLTTESLKLVFLEVDPYYALFNFWSSEATIGGIIVLVVTLLLSLIIERPWCKYVCPFGALIGLSNFISIFKIKRNKSTCIGCKKCDKVCPMNIEVSKKEVIKDHQCIRCGECTSDNTCPIEETVEFRTGAFKQEVKS
ncbi:4Fe-4S binding protein [Abyssisolibacter fermentans]|uniref:4Fe-4S binding protein n=1 Tax=Abyssisolibacter fermentans TaxID=1766203 RepID=UPI00083379D7|nr:4Fe-4S binding protein [Abyssisolibacter fermentans]